MWIREDSENISLLEIEIEGSGNLKSQIPTDAAGRTCGGKISALTAHGTGPSPGEKAARYSSRPPRINGMNPEGHPAV
jgi:hypothetical protein